MLLNPFRLVAQNFGLGVQEANTVFDPSTTLEGMFEGVPIWVRHALYRIETRATLRPPAPFPFVIAPETFATKVAHFLGKHDATIGEPDFDAKFKIETPHIDAVKALLTPALRDVMTSLDNRNFSLTEYGVGLTADHSKVDYPTYDGILIDMRHVVRLFHALRDGLARAG